MDPYMSFPEPTCDVSSSVRIVTLWVNPSIVMDPYMSFPEPTCDVCSLPKLSWNGHSMGNPIHCYRLLYVLYWTPLSCFKLCRKCNILEYMRLDVRGLVDDDANPRTPLENQHTLKWAQCHPSVEKKAGNSLQVNIIFDQRIWIYSSSYWCFCKPCWYSKPDISTYYINLSLSHHFGQAVWMSCCSSLSANRCW